MLKVHLIRSNEYSLSRFQEVVKTLGAFDGPIQFIEHEEEVSFDEKDLDEEVVGDKDFFKIQKLESGALLNEMSFMSSKVSYIPKSELDEPTNFKDVISWDLIFKKCQEFRVSNNIAPDDFIILLTERRNDRNWFTGGEEENNNLFVHTGYWDYFIEAPHQFPVAYECAASVLRKLMFDSFEELQDSLHYESIGCMNDFCENKEQIVLKLRTGDICGECIDKIQKKGVDSLLVDQVLNILDGLRKQMLFKNGFSSARKPSRLKIVNPPYECRILLSDYGNIEVHLTPLEKTLYLLYLRYPGGIAYHDLMDYEQELKEIYGKLARTSSTEEVQASIQSLINPHDGSCAEKVSKIKSKFKKALGEEHSEHYIISGKRGEVKKIFIDREFVCVG